MRTALHKTIAIAVLSVALNAFLTPAHAQQADSSATFLEDVRSLHKQGKLRACVELLESALQRWPEDPDVWLMLLDIELQRKRYAAVLRTSAAAHAKLGGHPGIHLRRGQAYYALGSLLGEIRTQRIPGGRIGQFSNRWLIVEKSKRNGTFVCCGEQSALFQVRRALDAGSLEPRAHLLHARIWQQLERPELAWAIVDAHRNAIVGLDDPEAFRTCSELALANDDVSSYLEFERARAGHLPEEQRPQRLQHAYQQVASVYGRSGRIALQVAFLKRAATLQEPPTDLSLQLADGLWALQRTQEAGPWYRRVLEQQPDTSQRSRILARLAEVTPLPPPEEPSR